MYDSTSNRTAVERKNGNKTEKTIYAYDAINQLTKETLSNGTMKEYSYDGFGNRIGIQVTEAGKSAVLTEAVFNDGNHLTKFGNESLTYNANGNRTSEGKYKYTWDEADQLIAITNQGESSPFATYKYDDDGRRIAKTVNGTTTRYHYDGDSINPLYETDGSGNVLRQYVYSVDGIRLAMTDENGQVVATYEYDAWGNVLKSDAKGIAADNPFGYAGYMYDKEIGMYYLIARYYNPDHGVFLSVDPDPGDEDGPVTQNGYTYADNNPVMMTDPDGKWAWLIPVAIAGARVVGKAAVRYGKQAAKWTANKAKDAWKNRKYTIQGPSTRNGRIFAVVNRKKKQTKTTDSRLFALDYHEIRENKKRTTRKVLHFHLNYKKNKHHIIYPKRSKVKWK